MATIIKAKSASRVISGKPIRGTSIQLGDLSERAESYVNDARAEAIKILNKANSDAEQIRATAEQAGRATALEQAQAEVDQKIAARMQPVLAALQTASSRIEQSRQKWLADWESAVLQLATRIAERIVRGELHARPEVSLGWIREALQLSVGGANVRLLLHPDDVEELRDQVGQVIDHMSGLGEVAILADAEVGRGECRVLTEFGEIDQRLASQLSSLERELHSASVTNPSSPFVAD